MKNSNWFATTAVLMLLPIQACASLVLQNAQNFQGSGLGGVHTILTLQSPRNSTNEAGSVGRVIGNPNDVRSGDFMSGASQTQTRTVADLGVTSAADLRVVFNALEPGNTQNSILLNDLQLNIYSSAGALLFNSGAFTSIDFADTFTGAGNSGFVFALDSSQAAAAQAAAFGVGFGSNIIGLSASASRATGGFETFFVASAGDASTTPQRIPEPGSLALAGIALLGAASTMRRKS